MKTFILLLLLSISAFADVINVQGGSSGGGTGGAVDSVFGRTGVVTATSGDYTKSQVGLGNVDNTSDATKNSAVATLTNKTLTSPIVNSPTGITKTDVGLSNVDNTSDATKNAASVTLTNKTLTSPVINSPTGIVKADVGLSNVDDTSDATKNAAAVTLTNKTITSPSIMTPTGIVKGDVGLGSVDNTSDATKNSAAVTLTNKTISAASNTISNISDTEIKAAAAIAVNKLAAQTASRVIVSDGSGFISPSSVTSTTLGFLDVGSSLTTLLAAKQASLVDFAESVNSATPNATIPVTSWTATNAATNVDIAVVPKGTGNFALQSADNTTAGGNKRGTNSTDLQTCARSSSAQVASGQESFAVGCRNTSGNTYAGAIGFSNTSTGTASFAVGSTNTANANYTVASGVLADVNSVVGRESHQGASFTTLGDNQSSRFNMGRATTTNITYVLTSDLGAPAATNIITLKNNQAYAMRGMIVAKQQSSTNVAAWEFTALAVRGANAAATTLVISAITTISNSPGWTDPTFAADTTLGGITITATGVAATNIRYSAQANTREVTY